MPQPTQARIDGPPAPIDRHKDGRYLLREVLNTTWGRHLAAAPKAQMIHWLMAPVALARSIKLLAPSLLERESIRVIVGGAAFVDTFDRGGWYQMVPWLLGRNIQIRVALVGPEAGLVGADFSHTGYLPRGFAPGTIHQETLSSFLAHSEDEWDVLMLFSPGFNAHMEWYEEPAITQFLEAGIPVLCGSQSDFDAENDLYVAGFHGLGTNQMFDNPFSLRSLLTVVHGEATSVMEARMTFAERLWRLQHIRPVVHPNLEQLRAACMRVHELNEASQLSESAMVQHARNVHFLGLTFMASEIDGAAHLGRQPAIALKNRHILLPHSGAVYSVMESRYLDGVRVPQDIVEFYFTIPPSEDNNFAQRLFVEWVWEEYVSRALDGGPNA